MEQQRTLDSSPFPTGDIMYRKEAARFLGISPKTLTRYVQAGLLRNWRNQVNGRTYYDRAELLKLLGSRLPQTREVWVYCRAAGIPDQGAAGVSAGKRLQAQVDRVLEYCTRAGIRVDEVIQEVGKADSLEDRPGLERLMEKILRKEISMIVVETPDRLARFAGAEILQRFFAWHGVEYHVIQKTLYLKEYRDEIKDDLAGILFRAKQQMGE
jgi:predicted site-specific integrase-resolvase